MSNDVTVLVVDDEPLARQKIRRLLAQHERTFAVLEASDGLEALRQIDEGSPDILFLDIEMPGLSGFEVLYHLAERPFKIIFQTAYDEFAIKAFEENACDYILKPYTPERFRTALDKALTQIEHEGRIRSLETSLAKGERYLEHLSIKEHSAYAVIDVDDVECFVSRDHYTCILAGGRELLTKLSLDHLAERLDPAAFLRVHRNAVVRLGAVRSYDGVEAVTAAGHRVEVSRRSRKRIQEWIKGMNL